MQYFALFTRAKQTRDHTELSDFFFHKMRLLPNSVLSIIYSHKKNE